MDMIWLLFSRPFVSDSLWPHGWKHIRPLCPSLSPKVCPSSCPLHWWCHPAISSSDILFSFCHQPFPASVTFPKSQVFAAETKILESQLQYRSFPWGFRVDFPSDWLVWSPCCPRDSQESSPEPQFERINSVALCLLYGPALKTICDHWEDHILDYMGLVSRVLSLLFNTLSRFVIAFLPRSKRLLISWLQSPPTVILEPKKRKSVTTSKFSPSVCHEVMGPDAMILVFLIFSFKPALSVSSFSLIKRLFSSSSLSAISGIIRISEAEDVSPSYLDSSL